LVVMITPMRQAFKLQMIDSQAWMVVIIAGLVPLIFSEIYKLISNRRENHKGGKK
jgi:hypothetical protein